MKDDWAWQSDLRAGNAFQLARDLRLSLGADLREQVWARFEAFNNVAPGGTSVCVIGSDSVAWRRG